MENLQKENDFHPDNVPRQFLPWHFWQVLSTSFARFSSIMIFYYLRRQSPTLNLTNGRNMNTYKKEKKGALSSQ